MGRKNMGINQRVLTGVLLSIGLGGGSSLDADWVYADSKSAHGFKSSYPTTNQDSKFQQHYKADKSESKIELTESPYKACKGINLVSKEEFDKDQTKWNKEIGDCNGTLQVNPILDSFWQSSVENTIEAGQIKDFLTKVVNRSMSTLVENRKKDEALRDCFRGPKAKEAACAAEREKIHQALETGAFELRKELALSLYAKPAAKPTKDSLMDPKFRVNTQFRDFANMGANPVANHPLMADEIPAIEATGRLEGGEALTKLGAAEKDPDAVKEQGYKLLEKHQKRYREILFEESPIFAVIKKPKWENGKPTWTDEQVADALDELIKHAENEHKAAYKTGKEGKIEFARLWDSKKPMGDANMLVTQAKRWAKGDRQLLDYMHYTPIIEQLLEEDKSLCGLATGLAQRLNTRQTQNTAGTAAAAVPTFMGLGFAGGAYAAAGTLLGAGMGFGMYRGAIRDAEQAKNAAASTSGLVDGQKAVMGQDRVVETEKQALTSAMLHPLDYLGLGKAGGMLFKGAQNRFITGKVAQAMSKVDMNDQATMRKLVNQGVKETFFKGRDPQETETALLKKLADEMYDKKLLVEDPNLPAQAHKENFQKFVDLVHSIFSKPAATKAELEGAEAAKDILLTMDPSIVKAWEKEGFDGFVEVYQNFVDEMRKVAVKDPAKLKLIMKDPKARGEVWDKALERAGVADPKTRQGMHCVWRS